jgi:sortase (surface protein transpeptidase)
MIVTGVILALIAALGVFLVLRHQQGLDFEDGFVQVQTMDNTTDPKDETLPEGDWVVAPDLPRYLSIDKIGIKNARVLSMGTKPGSNQLDDPDNINDVGWYQKSAKPGAASASQLAGLYDGHNTGINAPGVFYNLYKLGYGDIITIERGDGRIFDYAVREVETTLLENVDMGKMQKSALSGFEGLNLITCGGSWDETRQTYTHRVTVRATLVE